MNFFPPDRPHNQTEASQQDPAPWWKPSDAELPALFPIGEVIAQSDTVVLIVAVARVYSNGVEFLIDRRLRRGGLSRRDWQQMQWQMHDHYAQHDPDRLRYGVVLGDGQQLILDGPPSMYGEVPERHSLSLSGGNGGGSEDFYRFDDGMWLWPLPPEGPLEVVAQWPAFGIPESRVVLDSAPLIELAAQARPVWSER
ncbi:hypothetical protein [Leifsonia sp. NPDC058248]|uniref:hypothetical protein n=1 Tax=Leifsonia sp. NPDC058248 TaxID=3346402 RepID=UPI0036DAAAB4